MNSYFKAAFGLTALAATAMTQAATTTTTMPVSATVPASCTVSATAFNFGTTNSSGNSVAGSSSINVTCPNGTAYKVALDGGQHLLTGTASFRRMINSSGAFLKYLLNKPSGTQEWGDSDTANTYPDGTSLAGTGSAAAQTLIATGQTLGATSQPSGIYSDTVTVTVNF